MRCVPWFFAVGVCVVLGGCSSLELRSAASGAPAAHRLPAKPFLFVTNFQLQESDPIVLNLLGLREEVHDTLQLPLSEVQIEIYIFDDRPSFQRFMADHYPDLPPRRAFFIAQAEREVVYSFRGDRLDEDLRHETCHALVHAVIPDLPLWLDEGIAEYFESPTDAAGIHAQHLAELRSAIQEGWHPSLTRLETITQVGQMTRGDYRDAWGWVHFLLHSSPQRRGELLNYLADLRAGAVNEPFSSRLFRTVPQADTALVRHLVQLGESRSQGMNLSRAGTIGREPER